MDAISLIFLLIAIIIGFTKKLNVGFVAMAVGMILARVGGLTDANVIAGFSGSTFVTLLGITFWFAVINQSGVIDLLAKKIVAASGKQQWAIPFLMLALGFAVAYLGPGAVPACIVCILSIPLAFEMGVSPMLYCLPAFAGLCAGRISPFTPEGVWLGELGIEQGYTGDIITYVTTCGIIAAVVCTLACFIVYKGWKKAPNTYKAAELDKFNKDQIICLSTIAIMVIAVVGFSMSTPLTCIVLGVSLLLIGIGNEKETIRTMPWGTMVLVCGVGALMGIVNTLGGIDLLANMLTTIMSSHTAAGIMGITGGMMSWFSSSFGVVFPTLMPTVPSIVENVGCNGAAVLSAIAYGASIAGISPFSSGGSMCLSAMSVDSRFDASQMNKVFIQFFIWAVSFLVIVAILCFIGIFDMLAVAML